MVKWFTLSPTSGGLVTGLDLVAYAVPPLGVASGAYYGLTGAVEVATAGALMLHQQSMGGQDVASQHAGSLIAEITNSGPSAPSPHGSSVLPKGRRTVQARKGSKNFSRRRRRAPWCTLHKKSHWCANTRKTRYQPKK